MVFIKLQEHIYKALKLFANQHEKTCKDGKQYYLESQEHCDL